jgi:hypothetical protein
MQACDWTNQTRQRILTYCGFVPLQEKCRLEGAEKHHQVLPHEMTTRVMVVF